MPHKRLFMTLGRIGTLLVAIFTTCWSVACGDTDASGNGELLASQQVDGSAAQDLSPDTKGDLELPVLSSVHSGSDANSDASDHPTPLEPGPLSDYQAVLVISPHTSVRYGTCHYQESGLLKNDLGVIDDVKQCDSGDTLFSAFNESEKLFFDLDARFFGARFIATKVNGSGSVEMIVFHQNEIIATTRITENEKPEELRIGNQAGENANFPGWYWQLRRDPGVSVQIQATITPLHSETYRWTLDSEFEYDAQPVILRVLKEHVDDRPEARAITFNLIPQGAGTFDFTVFYNGQERSHIAASQPIELHVTAPE